MFKSLVLIHNQDENHTVFKASYVCSFQMEFNSRGPEVLITNNQTSPGVTELITAHIKPCSHGTNT